MSVNWGDVPTWVAGVGTVGTLAAALSQIRTERNRRLAADEQVRVEEHRQQARFISAYMGEEEEPPPESVVDDQGRTAFYLANSSTEPAYSVVVGMVFIRAGPRSLKDVIDMNRKVGRQGPVTTVSILPGGLYRVWIVGTGWHSIMGGRAGVEIAFSDAGGSHWVRRANGRLDELPEPPLEYLEKWHFYGPYDFQTPRRVPVI